VTDPPVPQVSLTDLGPLTRIGSGGQGTVFALAEDPRLVYKEYAARFVDDVDVTTLGRFVRLAAGGGPDAEALLGLAAWPTTIVRKHGVVRGFLMPRVPERFTVRLELPGGPETVLAQLQYLLNSEEYLRALGLPHDDRMRLELLQDTSAALEQLHRRGICVGDFSPNNLLFSRTARPRCYFIDCDAMRLDGDSVLAQGETPEWHMPQPVGPEPPEELATPATDAYKFGLLAVRLFAGDQQVRDPTAARRLRGDLRRLARRSLGTSPGDRPAPREWTEALAVAVEQTPPSPPAPRPPASPPARRATPPPVPAPPHVWPPPLAGTSVKGWQMIMVVIAVVVGVVVAVFDHSGENPTTGVVNYPLTVPTRAEVPDYDSGYLAPTYLPTVPALPRPVPTVPTFTLPPLLLCRISDIKIGPGLDPKSSRLKLAAGRLNGFLCSVLLDDAEEGLDGNAEPDATQQRRFAQLGERAPYDGATITGVRTLAGGRIQINVLFVPSLPVREPKPCRRSRLTLVKLGDRLGVSALTAPVAVSCR
jgi:hypothetical protein